MPRGVWERTDAHKRSNSEAQKGKTLTAEHKQKIGAARVGQVLKPQSTEHKRKLAETQTGEASYAWQGDEIGYNGLHKWVARHKERTSVCTHCGTHGRTHFANVSGDYLRDVDDFIELCVRCHTEFDGKAVEWR